MAAFFSAAARTPVSTIIIVSELTGGYDLLLPAMWVSALAHLAIGDRLTIYHEQVPTRAHSPAHWGQFSHVLRGLSVAAAAPVRADFVAVPVDAPLRAVRRTVDRSDQTTFPVVDPEGGYRGLLDRGDILALPRRARPGRAVALDLVTEAVEPVRTDEDLSVVLGRFARLRYDELPVVAPDHPVVVGMIRRQDLLALHEERLSGLSSDDP